ncbi:alanine racemase [Bermanella marisrubri]|uniref:Alanine racemase n=1 Tax=Bermanella marisrubri TaxID=207949 RepID=Q1N2K6_9GAMM|nr:alanine racemase [Bermanella marisrubri]EAT12401.1 alanine racemase [Oceanobacter sp. RED65] [Bermanella marisrubri]QIZ85482.1 alanine racemase [Bermanella marisrubri]
MSRPTQAIIDLEALRSNYRLADSLAPQSQSIAVVKANAYGHGAVPCAKALEPIVPAFAVASIDEAIELREGGIRKPILLLEGPFSFGEVQIASEHEFWLMIENHNHLAFIEQCEHKKLICKPLKCWLKMDSGMHRLGFMPFEIAAIYQKLKSTSIVHDEIVVATHFATADVEGDAFVKEQIDCFNEAISGLGCLTSLCNSAGVMAWPQAHGSWNRPGFMLYGASPFELPQHNDKTLQSVMTLQSKVISVRNVKKGEAVGYGKTWIAQRDSRIATVTVGYGDGYPRHAKNGTPILVNNQRCKLAGRVSMDMITVDVTDVGSVNIGDDVICWGKDLPINEVAHYSGTIGYELMTRMPLRPSRIYINA